MVETTEVAVAFLQESPWAKAMRARAQSANSTVDKPIREDGIDVDRRRAHSRKRRGARAQPYRPRDARGADEPDRDNRYAVQVLTATSQTLSAEQRQPRTYMVEGPLPQQSDILLVPGVSNAVFVNKDDERSFDRQTAYLNCFLPPATLRTGLQPTLLAACLSVCTRAAGFREA